MSESTTSGWETVVAGFGGPRGDDQAGWRLAEMLRRRADLSARIVVIYEPTQILDHLEGCRRLIIVDACRSGGHVGTITRLRWPDPRVLMRHSHSSHGVGVCAALRLMERLEQLPQLVDVFGIEVGDCSPGFDVSPTVLHAVVQLEKVIVAEVREVEYA